MPFPAAAQRIIPAASEVPPASAPPPAYDDIAGLVLAAPMVVDATIRSVTRIKGPEAASVHAGQVRLYIEADVIALVRGTATLPPRIGYVVDMAADARGNPPKLRKARVLLYARNAGAATADGVAQVQLVRADAQRLWSPATDALTRRIATEALAADAPPEVTGVGNAFHVPGALPGEGETQIFLKTATSVPVSLSIVSRPGQAKTWSVSLSEVVAEAATAPAADTLLWYRLACALPTTLPDASVEAIGPDDAAAARLDYQFVIEALGHCTRPPAG